MKLDVDFKFRNGERVKDRVSGHTGIIVGVLFYFNGCIQYGVKGALDKDGKIPDAMWLDEGYIEKIDDGISEFATTGNQVPGCETQLGPSC